MLQVSKWRLKHLISKMNYSKTEHYRVRSMTYGSKYPLPPTSMGKICWTHQRWVWLRSLPGIMKRNAHLTISLVIRLSQWGGSRWMSWNKQRGLKWVLGVRLVLLHLCHHHETSFPLVALGPLTGAQNECVWSRPKSSPSEPRLEAQMLSRA